MLGSVTANATQRHCADGRSAWGRWRSPDDAWLGTRGLRTLDIRLQAARREFGRRSPAGLRRAPKCGVLHPALPSCPGHEAFVRDFKGQRACSRSKAVILGRARAAFVDALALFGIGYSWGGFESLALPVDRAGCVPPSAGRIADRWCASASASKPHADLIADVEEALDRWRAALKDGAPSVALN